MARRRHYRGLVRFPGLGTLSMPSSVKPMDVALGVGLGLAGGIALNKGAAAAKITLPSMVPAPLLGGLASAAVLYLAQKKKNPARAYAHALGAALGGLAVWAYGQIQSMPSLAAYGYGRYGEDLRTLPAGFGGVILDNPRLQGYGGPIFDNPNTNLMGLARLQGMGDENEDGMFPAP